MLAVIKQGEATFELDGVKHTLTRLELEPPEPKFDLLAYVRSFFKKR